MPGVIALTAGFPPADLFPLEGITLHLRDGTSVDLGAPAAAAAQQYNTSLRGHPLLLAWVARHTAALHRPPAGHEVVITNGGNHSLELITSLFLDREDTLLLEEYSYPVLTESIALPKGYRTLGVPIDAHGIIPSGLAVVLEGAAAAAAAGGPRRPKMLYTVPVGQNPTGATITAQRRREVYELCRLHDVWILEDDPYFYLQWGAAAAALTHTQLADPVAKGAFSSGAAAAALQAVVPGLAGLADTPSRPASYLSLDKDQRVIRVDTFSKFLAPGLRLGWVTARGDVVTKLTSALQSHTVGPCGLSQAVAVGLLSAWGDAGLDAHLRRAQAEYAWRAAAALAAAQRELAGVAEWTPPSAGMFLWVRLLGVEDAAEVWAALREAKVVVCPGSVMRCCPPGAVSAVGAAAPAGPLASPFLRISFSCASEAELAEGIARLGHVLHAHRLQRGGRSPVESGPASALLDACCSMQSVDSAATVVAVTAAAHAGD